MRTHYVRVFQNNPAALAQMLALRLGGWRERSLARKFEVDRTSIRHWCIKFDIRPQMPEIRATAEIRAGVIVQIQSLEERIPREKFKYQHLFEEEENVNPGKSYREYVEEHRKKNQNYKFNKSI